MAATMENPRHSVLDSDGIGRLLLKLSLPALLGMSVMTLYNVVDTIFIGHYVGPLGIAGLSIVFPLQMLSLGIGQLTGIGGASLVSRSIGANNISRAERALGNAITATITFSISIMIIGLVNTDFWLIVMGSSETILPYARDYMTVILLGNVFHTFAMTLNILATAEGNARIAMSSMIIGAVTNIILDAIFIIPLGMGVKGAAWATVIAQIISVAYVTRYYYSGTSFLKIRLKNLLFQWSILKAILAIGVASLARMLATSLSAIFVNRTLIFYGGDVAISTFGIINRIMMFSLMPGLVIGQGLQPVLGFNYGAKRYDRALKAIKLAMGAALICGIVSFMVLYFFPEPFIRIFTSDNQLISLGSYAAKRLFLALYLVAFIMVGSLIFQAIGKVKQSFITSIARPALFLIPLVLVLPKSLKLDGIWLAFPITDALTFLLTFFLLIPQIREFIKKDKLTRKPAI